MADISHALLIKYGLSSAPTAQEIQQWIQLTDAYVRQGQEREKAGALAAAAIFRGFNSVVYSSEANSIETLLQLARGK